MYTPLKKIKSSGIILAFDVCSSPEQRSKPTTSWLKLVFKRFSFLGPVGISYSHFLCGQNKLIRKAGTLTHITNVPFQLSSTEQTLNVGSFRSTAADQSHCVLEDWVCQMAAILLVTLKMCKMCKMCEMCE